MTKKEIKKKRGRRVGVIISILFQVLVISTIYKIEDKQEVGYLTLGLLLYVTLFLSLPIVLFLVGDRADSFRSACRWYLGISSPLLLFIILWYPPRHLGIFLR